jgi:hypothetical protein
MSTMGDARYDPRVLSARWVIGLLAGATLLGTTLSAAPAAPRPSAAVESRSTTGTLALRGVLSVRSDAAGCPPGTSPAADECFARTGVGVVPGLGTVSEAYTFVVDTGPPGCISGDFLLPSEGRLVVAGKGEIDLVLAGLPDCFVPASTVLTAGRPFSITGGSGAYAGASGSGRVQHELHSGGGGAAGKDTWIGTLVVPALDFDVTAAVFSGAVARTVRAPRGKRQVRVTYRVTARDEVDGVLPVLCVPRSGSLFRIGRKTVICSATDQSGNIARARFTVTVRAPR